MFSISLFPAYNINVAIPALALFAISAWISGTTTTLIILIISMPFHYFLWDYHGDSLSVYQAKAIGTFVPIITTLLVGLLKKQLDTLQKLTERLDQIVIERTDELNKLIEELITYDENYRRSLGQDIHDGLGQNLTGLLLYSNSLYEDIGTHNFIYINKINDIAELIETALHLARRTSRTLFPLNLTQTSFETSLDELISFFRETTSVEFAVKTDLSEHLMKKDVALHLYRIIHEIILNTTHFATPSRISIRLLDENDKHCLRAQVDDCIDPRQINNNIFVELMRYRAQLVNGELDTSFNHPGKLVFNCHVPASKPMSQSKPK